MSENSMMAGYAIKMGKVDEERIDELYNTFDSSSLNHWQWMYDESGHECLVFLVDAESSFYDDLNIHSSLQDMQAIVYSAIEFSNDEPKFELNNSQTSNLIFFAKIWYNGSDKGTIF